MYGVCRICGCVDSNACQHPDHGACFWVDDTHELCSHCYVDEIINDPATQHPKKKAFRELPVPFSTDMVQAINKDLKQMTRRTSGLERVNENPDNWFFQSLVLHASGRFTFGKVGEYNPKPEDIIECKPRFNVGDQLWVKETYQHTNILNLNPEDENYGYVYKADGQPWESYEGWKWKPGRFMPKIASRTWLEVTEVKCERLQDISDKDCIAEGILRTEYGYKNYYKKYPVSDFMRGTNQALLSFKSLWWEINGEESWIENSWVFAYTFKKIQKY